MGEDDEGEPKGLEGLEGKMSRDAFSPSLDRFFPQLSPKEET